MFADKMSQFSLLPEEILLQIFSFLSGRDILILSRVSSFLFNLLKNEHIWKTILDKEHLSISKHVEKLSKSMEGLSSLPPSKLHYMAVQKLHKRWVTGSSQKSSLVISYNRADTHFRKSDNFLAFVDPDQSIKLYDLTSPEPSLLSNWTLNSERKISIMFVLKSYLVIGYFDDFSLSLRTYSLQSFTLLWEEQNIIDCRNLMRSYHQDMYNFEDIIAVFRSGSISLYSVGDISSKHLRVKQDIDVQDGIFQYPRFSSFSESHYVHPFQVFPTSLHDQVHEQVQVKHRIYCWSLSDQDNITVKTLTMGTPVDPHSIFIMTGVSSSHCYGLHGSTLVSWSLSTGDLVSQACLSVPGHMMCVGDIDVMAGVCSLLLARQGSTVQRSYIGRDTAGYNQTDFPLRPFHLHNIISHLLLFSIKTLISERSFRNRFSIMEKWLEGWVFHPIYDLRSNAPLLYYLSYPIMLIQKRSDWLQCKNGPLDVRLMQYTLHVFCLTLRKWKVLRRTVFCGCTLFNKKIIDEMYSRYFFIYWSTARKDSDSR